MIGRLKFRFGIGVDPPAIVVVDAHVKAAGAPGDGLTDSAHAEDAEALAGDPVAEHPGRRPTGPLAGAQGPLALGQPARHRQDQRHGHVRGILGQNVRRVGDGDAEAVRGPDIDVVDARAVVGDELDPPLRRIEDFGVDPIGDGRNQHVGGAHSLGQTLRVHRLVVQIETDVEQLHHSCFNDVGELSRYDDVWLLLGHGPGAAGVRPSGAAVGTRRLTMARASPL